MYVNSVSLFKDLHHLTFCTCRISAFNAWISSSWTDRITANHAFRIYRTWKCPQLQFQMRKISSHIWDFNKKLDIQISNELPSQLFILQGQDFQEVQWSSLFLLGATRLLLPQYFPEYLVSKNMGTMILDIHCFIFRVCISVTLWNLVLIYNIHQCPYIIEEVSENTMHFLLKQHH